jgi:hypothetical protein
MKNGDGRASGNPDRRASESRLLEIRRQAEQRRPDLSIGGAGSSQGYYGLPVLKGPQWKWEVPTYLFAGGTAGAAAVIAAAGKACGADPRLVRDARWLAAICGAVSPPLLISDLGKPSRFLAMLRVLKLQSPMSVGAWTLLVFSNAAAASAWLGSRGRNGSPLAVLRSASHIVSAVSGLALTTYTGVLLGATAIPAWSENAGLLPFHFAASGLGSAVSILQLVGHDNDPALHALGIASAAAETLVGARIEIQSKPALRPLKEGQSGWLTRTGGLLSGPLPLALRLLAGRGESQRAVGLRRAAAVSTIAGSLITRVAWVRAGQASARDPQVVLDKP